MPKSVIFVTTETSGSQSLWRIQSAIAKGALTTSKAAGADGRRPRLSDLQPEGRLYMVRGVTEFEAPVYSADFCFVVNVRDPRDILCNQYFWLLQHPVPGNRTPVQVEAERQRRQVLHDGGIDAFVLKSVRFKAYEYAFAVAGAPGADALFVSYNQLCCDYDAMIARLIEFYGFGKTKHAESVIARESPAALAENERWIGKSWVGCDTAPGRYRHELRSETIAALDRAYAPVLAKLKALEQPGLMSHYDAAGEPAAPAA